MKTKGLFVILAVMMFIGMVSAAPITSGVTVTPNIVNSNPTLTATLTVSNTSYNIGAAEYFIDVPGIDGNGTPLSAADGLYNETVEGATASIDITGLNDGDYTVFVHSQNNNSEWGSFATKMFTVDKTTPTLTSSVVTGAAAGNRFSPVDGNGLYDSVNFEMASSEDVDWGQTKIYNSTLDEVKYFNGPVGYVNSNTETWDGALSAGGNAPDGVYTVETTITDDAGNSNIISVGTVTIDNTLPTGAISVGTGLITPTDLVQEITIDYSEEMDSSYVPMINFTNNVGEIRTQNDGAWSLGNTRWTETFLVVEADEESTMVTVTSSLARDVAGNSEGSTSFATFDIDTKAPVISDLSATTTDLEINNDNDVTIAATVVEGYSTINQVTLEGNWTGTWSNYTLTSGTSVYSYVIPASQLENQEFVGWKIYATDTNGNLRASNEYTFLVENRAPQFVPTISDLNWIEDQGSEIIDLDTYFYDEDMDAVTYTATIVSNPGPTSDPNPLGGITVNIVGNIATVSSTSDWNGDGTVIFTATDAVGETNDSNTVNIVVEADQNEAPVLTSSVSPAEFTEDSTLSLSLLCDAADPGQVCSNYRYDANYIDYDSNVEVSVDATGNVVLTPVLDWNGITYVKFLADDNGVPLETGSVVVKVNVSAVNDNPLLDAPDIDLVQNDPAPAPLDLSNYVTDVDNVLGDMSYTFVSESNSSLITCSLAGTVISCSAPTTEMYGISDLVVEVVDGNGGFDTQRITITVKQNHAPILSSPSPNYNPIIRTNTLQDFSIVAEDDGTTLNYEWFVDGAAQGINSDSFSYVPGVDGDHEVRVEVTDDVLNNVSYTWTLTASSLPIANTFTGPETTDFSTIPDLSAATGVVLQNNYGKIEFLAPVDLTNVFDLDNNVNIVSSGFAMNTLAYPELNIPARITLTGLSYSSIPAIYYTSGFTTNAASVTELCDFCNVTSITPFSTTDGVAVFEVDHFSSFAVKGTGITYNLSDFDELEVCEEGVIGNLAISIDDLDDGDDFKVWDEIEFTVEVENNGLEDDDFVVEAYLFDVEDDEEVASFKSDTIGIDKGDSENFDLVLEVPVDFDEDNNHIVFVKAYQKGDEDEVCNQEAVDVDLEREDESLILQDVQFGDAHQGSPLSIAVEVKNIGVDKIEDAYITVKQRDMKISEKSFKFDIEEYGKDDEYSEIVNVVVPLNTTIGIYDFEVGVVFEGEEYSEKFEVPVLEKLLPEYVSLTPIELKTSDSDYSIKSAKEKSIKDPWKLTLTLIGILIVGILIELILIAIVRAYKRSRPYYKSPNKRRK